MELPLKLFEVHGVITKWWIKETTSQGEVIIWIEAKAVCQMLGYRTVSELLSYVDENNKCALSDNFPNAASVHGDRSMISGYGVKNVLSVSRRREAKIYGTAVLQLLRILDAYDDDVVRTGKHPTVYDEDISHEDLLKVIKIYISHK
jgi:hypothetical protein